MFILANGDVSRLPALAAQLVASKPDLLVAQGSAAVVALQQATRTLPIIFAEVTDPAGQGFVESLARPGGTTTGFAMFEFSMGGKWLDLPKQLKPSTERVGVLFNPAIPSAPFGKLYFQSIEAAASRFGIRPFPMEIDDKADLERRLSDLAREPSSGLIVLLDAFTYVNLIRPHRARNVFQLLLACVLKPHVHLVSNLLISALGYADAAGFCDPFQTCGNIDTVTEQVLALDHYIANVDSHPEVDPLLWWDMRIPIIHSALHIDGTAEGVHH